MCGTFPLIHRPFSIPITQKKIENWENACPRNWVLQLSPLVLFELIFCGNQVELTWPIFDGCLSNHKVKICTSQKYWKLFDSYYQSFNYHNQGTINLTWQSMTFLESLHLFSSLLQQFCDLLELQTHQQNFTKNWRRGFSISQWHSLNR